MKYRLGLDMGATSIGWAIFDVENGTLKDAGVRIFDDGREDKSKASLCVKRRNARGARRLINRRRVKIQELLRILTSLGLFPQNTAEKEALKKENPYKLRKEALDRCLETAELGRALLQLAKRKGFKSNRRDNKEEGGKLKAGSEELKNLMADEQARTYGEFLYNRQIKNAAIRLKDRFDDAGKFVGGFFPFRDIYVDEFDKIWDKQKEFYPQILTEENKKRIKDVMFFQRPLKEAEEGECTFEKGEKRIPKAHPLFQEFRIWQNLLNLEFSEEYADGYRLLSKDENERLAQILQNPTEVKPNAKGIVIYGNIKKALGLDKKGVFNYEKKERAENNADKGLLVNTTQYAMNNSKFMKDYWQKFSDEQKGLLINILFRPHNYINFPKGRLSIEDEDKFIVDYLCKTFAISAEAAEELLFDISLEDDTAALSEKALCKILPNLKLGMRYAEACQAAGYHHSDKKYSHLDKLPYYGELLSQSCLGKRSNPICVEEEFGRISNATVHVALNQVRHLVNEIIDRYGKPYDIAVEYARDLNASAAERSKMSDTRDKNEAENQKILAEMTHKIGEREYTKRDIQKYKIWQRMSVLSKTPLKKECPFTGKEISIEDLINGQKVQIEHLIPFSRSLDDSLNNKVLAYTYANRYKGNRTPFEAFGESKDGYNWKAIQQRAKRLSAEQQWRFAPDAMKRFEEQEGPIARSINDTRYMTRLLQDYLQPIVEEGGKQRVQAVAGILTSMVRNAWGGLNQYKNKENKEDYRAFHNHHAVDAIIVAAINRGQIAEVSKQLKGVRQSVFEEFKSEFYKLKDETISEDDKADLKKRIKDFVKPRENAIINRYFKMPENMKSEDILDYVARINISHKPNLKDIKDKNSTIGKLHEDSAYGLQKFVDDKSLKAVFGFKEEQIVKEIMEYIPMFYHQEDKNAYYDAFKEWFVLNKKAATLVAVGKEEKNLKMQLAEKEQAAIYKLREASVKAFKWFIGGGNFCAEVYEINTNNKINGMPTKDRGEWKTEIVSNYNATVRQARGEDIGYWRYKYPNAKRIMTLRRNDMILATFTREQAFDKDFPKGLQDYVCEKFEADKALDKIDILFRVKKMGGSSIYFTPHDIAKETADTKSWQASASSMQKYQARKVHVTFTGRIQHAK